MDTKLRVVQYGCGKMSKYLMKYIFDNGGEIVAAFDNEETIIGKDIGEIIGCENKGIKISSIEKVEVIFKKLKPDACIVAIGSRIKEVKDIFLLCAKNGVNAISTCEEGFYIRKSLPLIISEIDKIAKENNCTIMASGNGELFWGNIIYTLSGSISNISKIKSNIIYNIENNLLNSNEKNCIGFTLKEFENLYGENIDFNFKEFNINLNKEVKSPLYILSENEYLCSKLELTPLSHKDELLPEVHFKDIKSNKLNFEIKAGCVRGITSIVTTYTEEDIIIESKYTGLVYDNDEFDKSEWIIEGDPTTSIVINKPPRIELSCAMIVNILPQLINCEPGFIGTEIIPKNAYLKKPLNFYVK